MNRVDYLIVGLGIAGAAVALQLLKLGKKIMVIDEPTDNQASRVAAGLFNPVTGKVMSKTWNASKLFPYLHSFYKEAEATTGRKFFHEMPICIPFLSVEEQNNWMIKAGMDDFVEEVFTGSRFSSFVNDRFGGVVLKHSGYVDTAAYLEGVGHYLNSIGSLAKTTFDSSLLQLDEHFAGYDSISAKAVIFCEGTRVLSNPLFRWVPVRPLKGETLQIRLQKEQPYIFNRGVYVVPSSEGTYRVGSTYNRDIAPGATEAGKKEILEKLDGLLSQPYIVTHHDWGIRPTSPDRRPIVGRHPELKNVWILNGLGTKGVSLAPWASAQLVGEMSGSQIENDVNISRFYALYSKF